MFNELKIIKLIFSANRQFVEQINKTFICMFSHHHAPHENVVNNNKIN